MSDPLSSAFTPERSRTLTAVVGRILPGTRGPGAAGTGVAVAFEGAMRHRSMRGLRPGIEMMLDQIEAFTQQIHGTEFSACAPDRQDEMLRQLEQFPDPMIRFLFRAVIAFSLEGLLGDPVHGGNRDGAGWSAIGLQAADVRSGLCIGTQKG